MRRSILTKALIELWGEGEDVAALKSAIDAYPDERKAPFLAADRTFKVEIEDFGKSAHGTREDNWSPIVHRIDALKPSVEFLGRARMKNPDNLFWSVEVAPDLDGKDSPATSRPASTSAASSRDAIDRASPSTTSPDEDTSAPPPWTSRWRSSCVT